MKKNQLIRLKYAAALVVASIGAPSALASGPIELVVAYSAGGVSDLMGRNLAATIESGLNQKMIVQNRPGAAGMVGTDFVFKAKPDGQTVLLARIATLAVAPNLQKVPYDPTGFTPLGLIATDPFVCVTSSRKNLGTVDEVRAVLAERPGTLTYSSSGVGSLNQFAVLRFLEELGVDQPLRAAAHIPSQGEGPALTAVAGGHIDLFCGNVGPVMPQVQSGTVKALFVTAQDRIAGLDEVPTVKELGLDGLTEIVGWSALMGPPNMDEQTVSNYVAALDKVKNDEAWQRFIRKMGSEPRVLNPAETAAFIAQQQDLYKEMALRMGIKK